MRVPKFYLAIFICGLLDAVTTWAGLSLGFVETRLFFVPFLSTVILVPACMFIGWRALEVPNMFRDGLKTALFLIAFYPVLNNLYFILFVM